MRRLGSSTTDTELAPNATANKLLRDALLMFPRTWLAADWIGAPGVLLGQQMAALSVAAVSLWLAWTLTGRLAQAKVMPKRILWLKF